MSEDFRTLYVDPGDETGWCLGRGFKLLSAGQHKLWYFADEVWAVLEDPNGNAELNGALYARRGVTPGENEGPIGRIVCEDFRLYPEKAKSMSYDPIRTARLIGALTFMSRIKEIPFVLQPASIKSAAQAAGAEELYYKPLKENRHQNDAIQHFVFFTNTELRGIKIDVPNQGVENAA